ncbi:MAG TPA: hypothetical protein VII69_10910 [Candidatus Eremiobacteraceae bacterium]
MKEPTTSRDAGDQKTGASAQFLVLAAAFVVVIVAMFVWRPWLSHPPAPPLRVNTQGPNAQPTTTIIPTP